MALGVDLGGGSCGILYLLQLVGKTATNGNDDSHEYNNVHGSWKCDTECESIAAYIWQMITGADLYSSRMIGKGRFKLMSASAIAVGSWDELSCISKGYFLL